MTTLDRTSLARGAALTTLAILVALVTPACTAYLDDYYTPLGEPVTTGSGGSGGTDADCVPSGTSAAVADRCGAFISPDGDDINGDGTRSRPFATLARGLTKSATLYVCAGATALDEALAVEETATLFGGLDCKTWIYQAGSKTSWTAPEGHPVATLKSGARLRAEDFSIHAKDAPALAPGERAPGRSSIAVVAETGTRLELARCDVLAGNGGDGAAGEPPVTTGQVAASGGDGEGGCDNDAAEVGAFGAAGVCGGLDVSGGSGGNGARSAR